MFTRIFLVITGGYLMAIPVAAHSPSDMAVSYHEISRMLMVTITHQVPNPQNHFVKVRVTINGRTVNDTFYTSQPDPDTFTCSLPIVTKPGDEIAVTASCSQTGSLTRILYNTGPPATTPVATAPPVTPVPAETQKAGWGPAPLFGAAAAFLIRKKE